MPSSYSASLRFELQFTGENVNTWGSRLNLALSRVDFSIAGVSTINTDGGTYVLSSSNTADDEARAATLIFTGLGGAVNIPSVPKHYRLVSRASAAVTVTAGSAAVPVDAGDVVDAVCDGSAVIPLGYRDSG